MKRSQVGSDGTAGIRESLSTKRTKSSQACSSCRRHKTRCELLDDVSLPGALKCHRCKVLSIECSFETSDIIHIIPNKQSGHKVGESSSLSRRLERADGSPSSISSPSVPQDTSLHLGITSSRSLPRLNARDIIPYPNLLWSIINVPPSFDWTVTPILAVQELAKLSPSIVSSPVTINHQSHLRNILSQEQITSLCEIFEVRYGPWINVHINHRVGSTPLLDLVRCTVASRHLDPVTRTRVGPHLFKLTEEASLQQIFSPMPSMEYIEALLILSLWSPVCISAHGDTRDPRLLNASAVSMAMNLRLAQASSLENSLRDEEVRENGLSRPKAAMLSETSEKARLWMLLSTVESMLCLGTGRMPLSKRSQQDYNILDLSTFSTYETASEMRLGLMAKLYDATESGCALRLPDHPAFQTFHGEASHILQKMDCIRRIIAPLPVVSPYDTFHFQVLLIQYHACRLLVLNHILQELRRLLDGSEQTRDLPEHSYNQIAGVWIRDALSSAEAALTCTLGWTEYELLSTIPDAIFGLIGFAGAWLVLFNFMLYQVYGSHTEGATERLLYMIVVRLSQIALAPDHPAAKCSHLISTLLGGWDRLLSRQPLSEDNNSGPPTLGSPPSLQPSSPNIRQYGMHGYYPPHRPVSISAIREQADDQTTNTGVYMEPNFWPYMPNNGPAGSSRG